MKPVIFRYAIAILLQGMSYGLIPSTSAQQVLFDFDSAPLYSSFPLSQTVSGITAHFTAQGQGYSIQQANVLGFTPPGFSGNIIYPNSINLSDIYIRFDVLLTEFSIMYACQELGCDDAATMRVTAFRNGSYVGTNTRTATNPGTWPVDTLSCSFTQGFDSVKIHYDSPPPTCQDYGTIFIADNMRVTSINPPLPVTLVYFTCEPNGTAANLKWRSADEIDLESYIVQYARDGREFIDLATIAAVGSDHNYQFIHQAVMGTAYYRLKMMDQDGRFKFSEIRRLIVRSFDGLIVVPNPSASYIQLYFEKTEEVRAIQLISPGGQIVKTISQYLNGQKINVSDLPQGVYIIKVFSSRDRVSFEKLFLKK